MTGLGLDRSGWMHDVSCHQFIHSDNHMVRRHVMNALVTPSDAEGSLVSCNWTVPCSLMLYGRTCPCSLMSYSQMDGGNKRERVMIGGS